mmetsp:Transcript_87656/g.151867  ORF Transcript_87656/g.151867 Transcript_87656/m.151867 type:complete len:204 (+) Transcript_87656:835-1446(+)
MPELPECFHYLCVDVCVPMPLSNPWVLKSLLCSHSDIRVFLQQRRHKFFRLAGDAVPPLFLDRVPARLDVHHLLRLGATKWHVAGKQYESDHAQTPKITLAGVAAREHLWSCIGQSAQALVHLPIAWDPHLAEAKIDQLQMTAALLVQHEVFELQITVNYAVAVNVVQSQEHLPNCVCSILFREAFALGHAVKELTSLHALHH